MKTEKYTNILMQIQNTYYKTMKKARSLKFVTYVALSAICLLSSVFMIYLISSTKILSNVNQLSTYSFKKTARNKDFFIGVFSECNSTERRDIIRTWVSYFEDEDLMDVRFILDHDEKCMKQLHQENTKRRDLVFVRTKKQGYYNLIHKTQATLFYAAELKENYKYVIKTDDDAIVRWDMLKDFLLARHKDLSQNVYFGFMKYNQVIHTKGKYDNTPYFQDVHTNTYPPFANGPMYGISMSAAKVLNEYNKIYPLPMWEMEDTTVGHWMTMLRPLRLHIDKYAEYGLKCWSDRIIFHPFKNATNMIRFMDTYNGADMEEPCKYFVRGLVPRQ
ncbi:beta-1,3-galactosyltransferase [Acrasis kona]|uniref:Hexosyltransferase n=1 Tax=Acrasis kona TaxID=1008807 RepID=A0AAW2Z9Q1_9EUKA